MPAGIVLPGNRSTGTILSLGEYVVDRRLGTSSLLGMKIIDFGREVIEIGIVARIVSTWWHRWLRILGRRYRRHPGRLTLSFEDPLLRCHRRSLGRRDRGHEAGNLLCLRREVRCARRIRRLRLRRRGRRLRIRILNVFDAGLVRDHPHVGLIPESSLAGRSRKSRLPRRHLLMRHILRRHILLRHDRRRLRRNHSGLVDPTGLRRSPRGDIFLSRRKTRQRLRRWGRRLWLRGNLRLRWSPGLIGAVGRGWSSGRWHARSGYPGKRTFGNGNGSRYSHTGRSRNRHPRNRDSRRRHSRNRDSRNRHSGNRHSGRSHSGNGNAK